MMTNPECLDINLYLIKGGIPRLSFKLTTITKNILLQSMTFTQNEKSSLRDKLRNSSHCTNIVHFQKLN